MARDPKTPRASRDQRAPLDAEETQADGPRVQLAKRLATDVAALHRVKSQVEGALDGFRAARSVGQPERAIAHLLELVDHLVWLDLPELVVELSARLADSEVAFRAAAPEAWGRFVSAAGLAQAQCGDSRGALATLGQALRLSRKARDLALESTVLQNLGVVRFRIGDRAKALGYYQQSLRLKQAIKDSYGESQVLNNLAAMAIEDGRLNRARVLLGRSLEIKRRLRDRRGLISAYGSLGNLATAEGDPKAARRHFRRALRHALSHGSLVDTCLAHLNVGNALTELGDLDAALSHFTAGLDLAAEADTRRPELMLRKGISVALARAARYDEARDHFLALAGVARMLGERFDEAMAHHDGAVMAAEAGEVEGGIKSFGIAARKFRLAADPMWHARTLQDMASILASVGRLDECRRAVNASVRTLRRSGHRSALAEAYARGVSILLSTGRADWALALFRRERQFLSSEGNGMELARRLWEVGSLLVEYHEPRRAIYLLRQCVTMYKPSRRDALLSLVRSDLARARAEAGQLAAACSEYTELLRHCGDTGDRVLELQIISNLAEVTRMRGDAAAATSMGRQALELARQLHDLTAMPMILNNLGLALQDAGDSRAARKHCRESAKLARQVSDAEAEARALSSLGSLEFSRQRYEKALAFYDHALRALGSGPGRLTPQLLSNRLAALIALGRSQEASEAATRAIAAAERAHDYDSVDSITWQVAEANLREGSLSSAAEALIMGLGFALLRGRRRAVQNLSRWVWLLRDPGEVPYDKRTLLRELKGALRRRMPNVARGVIQMLDQVPAPTQLDRDLECGTEADQG